jgi:hypothetical protein
MVTMNRNLLPAALRRQLLALGSCLLAACVPFGLPAAHGFGGLSWPDDQPVWVDADRETIPEPPERAPSEIYDFLDRSLFQQFKRLLLLKRYRPLPRAYNVNRFEGVPDSAWFENRHPWHPLTPEQLRRGPDTIDGPAPGIWTVTAGKDEGSDPGFRGFVMRDSAGERFVVKFDPRLDPEMLSAAEVTATKFYHAAGYHVPQNFIAIMDPAELRVREDRPIRIVDADGETLVLTPEEIVARLKVYAPELPDGRFRCIASRYLPGKPKGPFSYTGTNPHDRNDIYPHEHRRELRALRLLHGWLNNTDAREINTLDMYVDEGGRQYLKHHIIDVSGSLGSYDQFPKTPRLGAEYMLDASYTLKRLFTLGLYTPAWMSRRASPLRGVGLFNIDASYEPSRWTSSYPVVAFQNMTPADAYWMARIILSFTPEHVRAGVEAGQFSDPAAAEYVYQTLLARRQKIIDRVLPQVCPAESFSATLQADRSLRLELDDVPSRHAQTQLGPPRYRAELWSLPGKKVLAKLEAEGESLVFPSFDPGQGGRKRFLVVLRRQFPGRGWSRRLGVYLLVRDGKVEVEGLEHES